MLSKAWIFPRCIAREACQFLIYSIYAFDDRKLTSESWIINHIISSYHAIIFSLRRYELNSAGLPLVRGCLHTQDVAAALAAVQGLHSEDSVADPVSKPAAVSAGVAVLKRKLRERKSQWPAWTGEKKTLVSRLGPGGGRVSDFHTTGNGCMVRALISSDVSQEWVNRFEHELTMWWQMLLCCPIAVHSNTSL